MCRGTYYPIVMHAMSDDTRLLPALLKYWRGKRGLSQLDLALAAGVSARHISFLETGRARASEQMLLLLTATLDIPLRDRNAVLRAAGFTDAFPEPAIDAMAEAGVESAISRMMAQHEPYPMLVIDRWYDVRLMNRGARTLIGSCVPRDRTGPFNALAALFDPDALRPYVLDWDGTAREIVSRLHREVLHRSDDVRLVTLLDQVLRYPGVPESWRHPDLSRPAPPTLNLRFRVNDHTAAFLVTVTSFSAPQNVTLDELRIESCFPLDDATGIVCERLAGLSDRR